MADMSKLSVSGSGADLGGSADIDDADKRPPTCPKCLELYRRVDDAPPAYVRVETLMARADVLRAAPDKADGHRHSARATGIKYHYRLDKSEMVKCCFPDRTPHGKGSVISMDCGLTLYIGHNCVAANVYNAKALFAAIAAGDRHRARLSLFAESDNILQGLRAALADINAAEFFRDTLGDHFDGFVREMTARATGAFINDNKYDAKYTRTVVHPETRKTEFLRLELYGLGLFTSAPKNVKDAIHELDKARSTLRKIGDVNDPANESEVEHVAKAIEGARVRLMKAERWVAAARPFMAPHNLGEAVFAARVRGLDVKGDGYEFTDRKTGKRMHISLRGLHPVEKVAQPHP